MVVFRSGAPVAVCDGCWRVRRLVWTEPPGRPENGEHVPEPGWETFAGRFPAAGATHVWQDTRGRDHAVAKFQPAQDGHRCPECIAEDRPVVPPTRAAA